MPPKKSQKQPNSGKWDKEDDAKLREWIPKEFTPLVSVLGTSSYSTKSAHTRSTSHSLNTYTTS
jgi:hypothetical protein